MMKKPLLLFMLFGSIAVSAQNNVSTVKSTPITIGASKADSAAFFMQKGLQEKKDGRLMESKKNFEKANYYDPNNKEILAELSNTYINLRDYGKARETFKQLETLGDISAANYKQLMMLSFNLKQSDDAVKYANLLKKADPAEKVSYYIGKVEYDRDNYGEAIQQLNKAATEDPANAEIQYMLGHTYADMQTYKFSIPFYLKAIALDTSKSNWVYELGLIYYAINDDKNTLKYIQLAGDRGYKKDADYLQNLGMAYLAVGNFDQGMGILLDILKKRPADMGLLDLIAQSYYDKGKYQDAMDYWDTELGYDKTNASALYMIGMCYQKKGDKAKGIQLCDKAIAMDPALASHKQKRENMGM